MAASATSISRPRPTRRRAAPIPACPAQEHDDLAAAEADRRRRPGRPAQCRQVDLPGRRQRGQAEDRRLSLHDAASRPRRRPHRRARIRHRRHSRPDRGRARGRRHRRPLPRPCRAHARAAPPGLGAGGNPAKACKTVRGELEAYGNGLADKSEIVALSQADTIDADAAQEEAGRAEARRRPRADPALGRHRRGRRSRAAGADQGDRARRGATQVEDDARRGRRVAEP